VLGGTLWIWSMLFTGYFLGRFVPGIDKHIEKVIIAVIFLSILPGIIGWIRERRAGPGKREPGAASAD
jgi:membrane-associated protein